MSKNKQELETKTEWEFNPTLEIEPELSEDEIMEVLAKLSRPVPKPSDQEKKETSA